MSVKKNRRGHNRTALSTRIRIGWKDRYGNDKFADTRSLDISELGIRIEMTEPIEQRSFVMLRNEELGLHGTASVRTCIGKGRKYVVGLEFSRGMKWTPPTVQAPRPTGSEDPEEGESPS